MIRFFIITIFTFLFSFNVNAQETETQCVLKSPLLDTKVSNVHIDENDEYIANYESCAYQPDGVAVCLNDGSCTGDWYPVGPEEDLSSLTPVNADDGTGDGDEYNQTVYECVVLYTEARCYNSSDNSYYSTVKNLSLLEEMNYFKSTSLEFSYISHPDLSDREKQCFTYSSVCIFQDGRLNIESIKVSAGYYQIKYKDGTYSNVIKWHSSNDLESNKGGFNIYLNLYLSIYGPYLNQEPEEPEVLCETYADGYTFCEDTGWSYNLSDIKEGYCLFPPDRPDIYVCNEGGILEYYESGFCESGISCENSGTNEDDYYEENPEQPPAVEPSIPSSPDEEEERCSLFDENMNVNSCWEEQFPDVDSYPPGCYLTSYNNICIPPNSGDSDGGRPGMGDEDDDLHEGDCYFLQYEDSYICDYELEEYDTTYTQCEAKNNGFYKCTKPTSGGGTTDPGDGEGEGDGTDGTDGNCYEINGETFCSDYEVETSSIIQALVDSWNAHKPDFEELPLYIFLSNVRMPEYEMNECPAFELSTDDLPVLDIDDIRLEMPCSLMSKLKYITLILASLAFVKIVFRR